MYSVCRYGYGLPLFAGFFIILSSSMREYLSRRIRRANQCTLDAIVVLISCNIHEHCRVPDDPVRTSERRGHTCFPRVIKYILFGVVPTGDLSITLCKVYN